MLCKVMGVHRRVDHLPQKLGASWAHRLSKKSVASYTQVCMLCKVMGVHRRVNHLPQKLGASWAHRLSKKSVASYTVRCACYVRYGCP